MSLNICYLIPTAGISGGIYVLAEHALGLRRKGHNVFFLNTCGEEDLPWLPGFGLKVLSLQKYSTVNFLAQNKIDVLVLTGWQTVYEAIYYKLCARDIYYFVQSKEDRFYPPEHIFHDLAAMSLGVDAHYFTEARWIKDWLETDHGKRDVVYAPNAVNHGIFFPCEPLIDKTGKLRVLIEGPLAVPFKKVDEAFLAVDGLDVEVWCVSSAGDLKPWQKPDVFFRGVPISDMRMIYSACDVLIKLSAVEGFFGPPLEMMACGGTAVTSRVTGYDEYIVDGENALTVKIGDVQGAREHIKSLLGNPRLLERLKKRGLETARKMTWAPTIDILDQMYVANAKQDSPIHPVSAIPSARASIEAGIKAYRREVFGVYNPLSLNQSSVAGIRTAAVGKDSEWAALRVKGWAVSTADANGPESVELLSAAGERFGAVDTFGDRPDVAKALGVLGGRLMAGFDAVVPLPLGKLSGQENDTWELAAVGRTAKGLQCDLRPLPPPTADEIERRQKEKSEVAIVPPRKAKLTAGAVVGHIEETEVFDVWHIVLPQNLSLTEYRILQLAFSGGQYPAAVFMGAVGDKVLRHMAFHTLVMPGDNTAVEIQVYPFANAPSGKLLICMRGGSELCAASFRVGTVNHG